ncbi:CGGC domain-containing protein [Chloroflexota bacterium]
MKIGIIRCDEHSDTCAGYRCFPAVQNKKGKFEEYDEIELVGFDDCGGCGRGKADKIVARATRLKEKGAEVIHLGNCLVGHCPSEELYEAALVEEIGIPIIKGTHPLPTPKK